MNNTENLYFRSGVPEWVKYVAILTTLFPTILVFAAATIGIPQAMGKYGFSANDVQFGMLVFYATVVSYTPLGSHFFSRIPAITYLWISVVLQILALFGAFTAESLAFLLVMRFLNAVFNTGINNICLDLLFGKLKTPNAREIGYGLFYGMVLSAGVFTSLLGSYSFDEQDLTNFYKFTIFAFIPGPVMLSLIMKNTRLIPFKLIRFKKMGWTDFIFLSVFLISLAYFLIYGQELNWLDDSSMQLAFGLMILFGILEFIRLKNLKQPYMNLHVFRYSNFRLGILMLIILYFIRGGFNLTMAYFSEILESPFIETNELLMYNVLGIVAGSVLSTYLLIRKTPMRLIWLLGFTAMLLFYAPVSFMFTTSANVTDFIFFLIIQGIGQGMLMNPIIEFYVSSVPPQIGKSAGGFGVMTRFVFFTISLSLINVSQNYTLTDKQQEVAASINPTNPIYRESVQYYKSYFLAKGVTAEKANLLANARIKKMLHKELYSEFAQNYYQWISALIGGAILLTLFFPAINRTIINLKNKQPFGAGF